MRNIYMLAVLAFVAVAASDADAQSAAMYYGGSQQTTTQSTDPLHGLSSNPWEGQSTTGAVSTQRVTTPWNDQTYYPTPPTDQYIGGKTTWNTAMGQEEIAPEVNIHNMLVMTEHLRSLGYQIPEGFDEGIRNSPERLHTKIMSSLQTMSHNQGEPVSLMSSNFISIFEDQTGLSIENLIGTSLDIIGNK